jgi:hypothetical protein
MPIPRSLVPLSTSQGLAIRFGEPATPPLGCLSRLLICRYNPALTVLTH